MNFFFSRVQRLREVDRSFLALEGVERDYPFVSLCGKEVNFIRPAATPIVFHSMVGKDLYFGGTLSTPFQPSMLAISAKTGHLYHKIESKPYVQMDAAAIVEYGLIRSSVVVALSDRIHPREFDSMARGSNDLFFSGEGEEEVLINILPTASEPGEWAIPRIEDE